MFIQKIWRTYQLYLLNLDSFQLFNNNFINNYHTINKMHLHLFRNALTILFTTKKLQEKKSPRYVISFNAPLHEMRGIHIKLI